LIQPCPLLFLVRGHTAGCEGRRLLLAEFTFLNFKSVFFEMRNVIISSFLFNLSDEKRRREKNLEQTVGVYLCSLLV